MSLAFERYFNALSHGDSAGAVALARSAREAGASLVEVLDGLVRAGQAEVGRRWAANEWSVAQEHRATSVSEDVVAALGADLRPLDASKSAVVTCVDGEWHALPARIVAAVLREGGWRVHFLGASVPVEHLETFLHDTGPDVTALSCMLPTGLMRARRMIEASRGTGVPVLAGGAGFGRGGAWAFALGANGTAPDAGSALATLDSPAWPRFCGPAPPLRCPDDEAAVITRRRGAIVAASGRVLADRWPAVRDHSGYQAGRTEEDLGYLVDFLAAALFVDDDDLYTDFIRWMAGILEARGVPRPALLAGLMATGVAVTEICGEMRGAARILAAGTAVVLPAGTG